MTVQAEHISLRDNDAFGTGEIIWSGRPSQLVNLPYYLACPILLPIPVVNILCLGYMFFRYLKIRCLWFELRADRLQIAHGILSKHYDNINLYRIKDLHIYTPWWLRIFGLGHLILITSDLATPSIIIKAVRNVHGLYNTIVSTVENQRSKHGIREFDIR